MSIAELGAVGEFVSAVVVVITLLYLTVQIRQTKTAVIAATHQHRTDESQNILLSMAASEELSGLNTKAMQGAELTALERNRLGLWWTAWLRTVEDAYYQWTKGLIDDLDIAAMNRALTRQFELNVFLRELWADDGRRSALREDFVRHVDGLITAGA